MAHWSALFQVGGAVLLCCLVCSAQPPSGGALLADSKLLVVNPDSGSVSAVDVRTEEKVAETPVGEGPRSLALSPDGSRLYVTVEGPPAALAVLDSRSLQVLATIPVAPEPYGVAADPHGRVVYITSTATGTVGVVRVSPFVPPRARARAGVRAAGPGLIARIPVGPRPKGLAISPDGSRLYVTHFLSGEISVIDTARLAVLEVVSTGIDSNMAQKIVLHPTNGRAYAPHIRSNTVNRFLLFDSTVFPVISAVDLAANRAVPRERIDLSLGQTAVNLPFDLAFSRDGQSLYVVGLGSGDVTAVDLRTGQKIARVDVGEGPRAIAILPDGSKAYVSNSLSDDVSVIHLAALRETKRIPVTASPLAPNVKRGKVLFFSSRSTEVARDRWMSCGSCHFDGEHDGRTWLTTLGIRNTTSMRGVGDTRPVHWSADRDEVQDFEHTVRDLQAGTGLLRGRAPNPALGPPNAGLSADLDALAAFVESLRPKRNPFLHDAAAVDRGRAIFARSDVGCARCHVPPRYTDSNLTAPIRHNVGTGDGPDERLGPEFDTPSLRALWDSAPYLHDGSAPTLQDVLTGRNPGDRHGRTSHLSEAERRDLIAFLMSL
jgi:YVTN family beta-propeller protein